MAITREWTSSAVTPFGHLTLTEGLTVAEGLTLSGAFSITEVEVELLVLRMGWRADMM